MADKGGFPMKKKALIISACAASAAIVAVIIFWLIVPFGMCEKGAFWLIHGNTLTLFGSGDIKIAATEDVPWNKYADRIVNANVRKGITSVGENVFSSHPALEHIFFSKSVETIAPSALTDCSSLISLTVDEDNAKYSSDESGVLFNKEKTVLIRYPCANEAASYKIPDSVTVISIYAFSDSSNLKEIILHSGIDDIENHAFSYCNGLETVYLPHGTQSIGIQSFFSCASLKRIVIPGSIKSVSTAAFSSCESLTEIDFVGTKDQWDALMVEGNNSWITTPSVIFISEYGSCGKNAEFVFTRDRELVIRGFGNVDDFLWNGFANRVLSVTVSDGIDGIGAYAFSSLKRAETVTIPESVQTIGDSAFYGFTSEQTVKIDNTEAFAKENFAPTFDSGCEAKIEFRQ